jgi:4,4'-diaponeurosporenoate glycosyltransferase
MIHIILQSIALVLAWIGFLRVFRFFGSRFPEATIASPAGENPTKTISVIIPARNESKRIERLLQSLANQSAPPLEIIVADDGSTDGTAGLALKYGAKVVSTESMEWKGKSAACFAGAQAARGELLVFFDADVHLAQDAIAYIASHAIPGAVGSIQPYHRMEKPYEHLSLYFNLVSFLGLDVGKTKNPFEVKLGFFGPCMWIYSIPFRMATKSFSECIRKDFLRCSMAGQKTWPLELKNPASGQF